MASCTRASPGGQSCEQWATLVSPSCVARYSAAASCCSTGERPLCSLGGPLAAGAPCVCRAADARGAFVVQGYACAQPQAGATAAGRGSAATDARLQAGSSTR
jgi:hypothetical protein